MSNKPATDSFEGEYSKPHRIKQIPPEKSIYGCGLAYQEMIEDKLNELIKAVNNLIKKEL